MANVTVTLPVELLDKLDDLVERDRASSRSKLIREAVEKHIKSL
jgi:metal-responsive CopG/Arc/MetJ family transcriptional regulator